MSCIFKFSSHCFILPRTGESRAQVVATSLRIITRLKKDWITTGRRPDGEKSWHV